VLRPEQRSSARGSLRQAALIALALAGAAALSFARVRYAGTLRFDQAPLALTPSIVGHALFGILAAIASWQYLGALSAKELPSLPRLLVGALVIHGAAVCALPLTSNDVFSNLCYGHMAALHQDPYVATPAVLGSGDPFAALVGTRWLHQTEVYGPVVSAFNRLLAGASTIRGAFVSYKLGFFAVSLALVLVVYGACRSHQSPQKGAVAFVFLAWNPFVAWELTAQAHNDVLMVLGMAGFAWAALADRLFVGVVCLALAACAKFAALPTLGLTLCMVARRSPRRAVALSLAVIAVGLACVLPFRAGFAPLVGALSAFRGEPGHAANSIAALLMLVTKPLGVEAQRWALLLCHAVGLTLLLGLAVRAIVRVRTLDDVVHESLLFLFAYSLIAAAWFQSWYVTWMFPLALLHRDDRMRWLVAVYSVMSLVQYAIPLDPLTTVAINAVILYRLWPLS
jgi:alpha-1,6-mannosyltransferase